MLNKIAKIFVRKKPKPNSRTTEPADIHGYVECMNPALVYGWAFSEKGENLKFSLLCEGKEYSQTVEWFKRHDVADRFGPAALNSLFRIRPDPSLQVTMQQVGGEEDLQLLVNGKFLAKTSGAHDPAAVGRFDWTKAEPATLTAKYGMTFGGIAGKQIETSKYCVCDLVLLLPDGVLLLAGWIASRQWQKVRLELETAGGSLDLDGFTGNYYRPDLVEMYPWSVAVQLGFVAAVALPVLVSGSLTLVVTLENGIVFRIPLSLRVESSGWDRVAEFAASGSPEFSRVFIRQLLPLLEEKGEAFPPFFLERVARDSFTHNYNISEVSVVSPGRIAASVDWTCPLDDDGILIIGWYCTLEQRVREIFVVDDSGRKIAVSAAFFPLIRKDVFDIYRDRFELSNAECGFCCLAPLSTRPGELRALVFELSEQGEVWLKLPTELPMKRGIGLVKDIFGHIPAPRGMLDSMYRLFSNGLGRAIEKVARSEGIDCGREVTVRQYGEPPVAPCCSIVVPLYGRYDFMRHQLAHFVEDPDFQQVDLLYVVDDPEIVLGCIELARSCSDIFQLPFRLLCYRKNLGFAGANNVGAHFATSENLLLLNSDVIPARSGWLAPLLHGLDNLPDVGAVAPLLLFYDGSVQHGGMVPRELKNIPGYLMNIHPGKGQLWSGGDEPSVHPLLTAACLMLKRSVYQELGGFDTGYLIGDFEDSDLCLKIRGLEKKLWLVPQARLYHLERQSQNLEKIAGIRQAVTLYNGWRYRQKITDGLLLDPMRSN